MTTLTIKRSPIGWRLGLQWALVNLIGFGISCCLAATAGFATDWSAVGAIGGAALERLSHTSGALTGLAVLGAAQWLILRRYVGWAGHWALAGVGGYALGLLAYGAVVALLRGDPPVGVGILLGGVVPLALAGTMQWLTLRRQVAWASLWVLSYCLLFLVAEAVAFAVGRPDEGLRADSVVAADGARFAYMASQLLAGIVGGVVFGVGTGLVLIWLARAQTRPL